MSTKVNIFFNHLTTFFNEHHFDEYKGHFFDYDEDIMVIVVAPEFDKEAFVCKLQELHCFRDDDQITLRTFAV